MTVTLKPKTGITVPKSIRRKAGIKPGDQFEFSVSGRVMTIAPKLSPDEFEDEREIRDPKVRAIIRQSHQDFVAGKSRPIEELFAERAAKGTKPVHRRPRA
jgi:AbrB family looped-hinge helix DNA binding protein